MKLVNKNSIAKCKISFSKEQRDFREGHGHADQIFTVRCLGQMYTEKHKDVSICGIHGFGKSYDRVDRKTL